MKFISCVIYFIAFGFNSKSIRNLNVVSVINTPFSPQATIYGDLVYVNGIFATVGNSVKISGGIKEQFTQTLSNIEMILQQAPSSKENIIKINVYISFDPMAENLDIINLGFYEFFKGSPLPSKTVIGVNKFQLGAMIQIDCIAKIDTKNDESTNLLYSFD